MKAKIFIFCILLLIGIVAIRSIQRTYSSRVLGESQTITQAQYRTDRDNWHLRIGKPFFPSLGPDQDIQLLPLRDECQTPQYKSGASIQVKLNEAFLTQSIRDLPEDSLNGHIRNTGLSSQYNRFLVIQGWAKNTSMPGKYTQVFSPGAYIRLVRNSLTYTNLPYRSDLPVSPYSLLPFWVVFPVTADETEFTLEFCPSPKPQIIRLNINSPETIRIKGNYSMDFGLFISP